jgi:hypothetical protein
MSLRTHEMSDSIDHIIKELDGHLENLKGDYLKQIIKRIKRTQDKIKICDSNGSYCPYTRDMSSNHMLTVCQEVMSTFGTLLK